LSQVANRSHSDPAQRIVCTLHRSQSSRTPSRARGGRSSVACVVVQGVPVSAPYRGVEGQVLRVFADATNQSRHIVVTGARVRLTVSPRPHRPGKVASPPGGRPTGPSAREVAAFAGGCRTDHRDQRGALEPEPSVSVHGATRPEPVPHSRCNGPGSARPRAHRAKSIARLPGAKDQLSKVSFGRREIWLHESFWRIATRWRRSIRVGTGRSRDRARQSPGTVWGIGYLRSRRTAAFDWRINVRRASGTERCTAPREGKALKGETP
jgi:hypothetical protein